MCKYLKPNTYRAGRLLSGNHGYYKMITRSLINHEFNIN